METIKEVLTDKNFLIAITTTIGFILLGFMLRKTNIFNEHAKKVLSSLALNVALPCLALNAFMADFDKEAFINNISVFIFSFLMYFIVLALSQIILKRKYPDDYKTYSTFIALGQLTLFSIPVLKAMYNNNSEIMISSNMYTLSFRLYLYIYAYFVISKIKINKENIKGSFKKIFINPIMIAMFLGIFIYLSQSFMFKVTINEEKVSILRFDKTVPIIYSLVKTMDSFTTPLAMMLIGITLGEVETKKAFTNKKAWIFAVFRSVIVPLFVFLIAYCLNLLNITSFDEYSLVVLVIGSSAPVSAVLNTYCINYDNNAYLASDICFLSTLLSILAIPILFVLVQSII